MTPYDPITTVIFDLDGTLIRHTWRLEQITEVLFARFATQLAPVSYAEFYQLYWPKNEDLWYMMVDGVIDGATAAEYGYRNTLRALGQDTALAAEMMACWEELVLAEIELFSDTLPVLAAIRRRYTTGILSNGFTALQRAKIKQYNLAAYVDFTLVSEEAGYHKPDRRAFEQALRLAGNASPAEALYVGDDLVADIAGAQQAGLTPILLNVNNNRTPPPDVIEIGRLSELLPLLQINLEGDEEICVSGLKLYTVPQ